MKAVLKILSLVFVGIVFTAFLIAGYKTMIKSFYPIKYENKIAECSEKYNLDKELIFAIIKTESNFNENAESYVGALGLMQLMPETFEDINNKSEEYGLKLEEATDIYSADVNIEYGSCYIKFLIDRYKNEKTAIAAYNAGPGNVDKWLNNKEFSKDGKTLIKIPFAETEKYVNKVCKTKEIYKKFYFEWNDNNVRK